MDKKNPLTFWKKRTPIQKKFIGGSAVVLTAMTVMAWSTKKEKPKEAEGPIVVQEESKTDMFLGTKNNDPFEDERETLDDSVIETTISEALALAQVGEWQEMVNLLEPYDADYDLSHSEASQRLSTLFADASALLRLTELGDNADAVESAVTRLPNIKNPEMFVYGLYFLPRNVLLDISDDILALAPTQRGKVEIVEKIDIPMANEENDINQEVYEHVYLNNYFMRENHGFTETGFTRFEVMNGDIEEYVYLAHHDNDTLGLIGFYSEDTNPANTTKSVQHYLEFRQEIQAGVEELDRIEQGEEPTQTSPSVEDDQEETKNKPLNESKITIDGESMPVDDHFDEDY